MDERMIAVVVAVRRDGLSHREAGQRVGISKDAAYRIMKRYRDSPDAAIECSLRDGLQQRKTISQIARETGRPRQTLLEIAHRFNLDYPNRPATDEQRDAVVHAFNEIGLTMRQAAAVAGISKSAACRIVIAYRNTQIDDEENTFHPVPVTPYRCEHHGRMTVSPCPACEAIAHSAAGQATSGHEFSPKPNTVSPQAFSCHTAESSQPSPAFSS